MNHFPTKSILQGAVIAVAFGLMTNIAVAAPVTVDAQCVPHLQNTDQRIYDKAHESPDALRRYLSISAGPMSNDVMQAMEWATRIDLARRRCVEAQVATGPAPSDVR